MNFAYNFKQIPAFLVQLFLGQYSRIIYLMLISLFSFMVFNIFVCVYFSYLPSTNCNMELTGNLAYLIISGYFWISKFLSKVTVYAPVFAANSQILIVICCIHPHIHHMSRIPFLILSFLGFVVFVVTTLIYL